MLRYKGTPRDLFPHPTKTILCFDRISSAEKYRKHTKIGEKLKEPGPQSKNIRLPTWTKKSLIFPIFFGNSS